MSHAAAAPPPAVRPGARARWGWMLFDWASQPFHTLIITFVFAPYFVSAVAPDPTTGQAMWGWAVSAGGLAVALCAPALGALADGAGPRKPWIAAFSLLYVLGSAMLWFATPGDPAPATILLWFVVGLIGVEFATVFTNAMMPALAPPDRLGRLSGSGWALGYVGGVVSLVVMLALLAEDEATGRTLIGIAPVLGLDPETREGTRAVGPLTALWFAVFVAPLFLWVPDAPSRGDISGALSRGWEELKAMVRDAGLDRPLRSFLIGSMLYRDALNGFYVFGGVYAAGVLGWSIVQIGVFGILAAAVGALGAWLGGRADGRFGPLPVVAVSVVAMALAALAGASVNREAVFFVVPVAAGSGLPDTIFYVVGAVIGAFGGALQSASRTLCARLAAPARMTAAFGIYALAGKATAFLAPALIAALTTMTGSQQAGVLPVAALFLVSLPFLLPVWRSGR